MNTMEQFLPELEIDEVGHRRKQDSLLIRFVRNKYKCIIMLMLSVIAIANSVAIVIGFLDKNTLQQLANTFNLNTNSINHTTSSNL